MSVLMDLVAGDAREILLTIALEDWAGLADRRRFDAYLPLGDAMEPSWLDLFAQAIREATDSPEPGPFLDATRELGGKLASLSERSVEKVDRQWTESVASLPDESLDRVAPRWAALIDARDHPVESAMRVQLPEMAAAIVSFCRLAGTSEDVLFIWSL